MSSVWQCRCIACTFHCIADPCPVSSIELHAAPLFLASRFIPLLKLDLFVFLELCHVVCIDPDLITPCSGTTFNCRATPQLCQECCCCCSVVCTQSHYCLFYSWQSFQLSGYLGHVSDTYTMHSIHIASFDSQNPPRC